MTALAVYLFFSMMFPLLILYSSSLTQSSPVSYEHDNLILSTSDFMSVLRKSIGVSLFFMLSFIIISLSLGGGSTSSTEPCTAGDDVDRFFPCFPLVYEMDNIIILCKERVAYDSYRDEEDDINHGYDYDGCEGDYEDNNTEIEEAYSSEDDDQNDSKDLEKKTEEFIAKVYQKWREEWLTDHRLLCLPAA